MRTMYSVLATALYTLSLSTLLAMTFAPMDVANMSAELGAVTVIAVEAPAHVAEAQDPTLLQRS